MPRVSAMAASCPKSSPEPQDSRFSSFWRPSAEPALKVACASAILTPAALWFGGGSGGGSGGGGGGGGDGGAQQPLFELAARDEDEDEDDEGDDEDEEDDDEEAEEEEDVSEQASTAADGDEEAEEDEDDYSAVDTSAGFFCDTIVAEGLPKGVGVPTEDELFAGLKCQPGFVCTRPELSEDLRTLLQSGLFDNVDARVVPGKKGKCKLMFVFKEKIWPQMSSFAVDGASLIPPEQVAKVMATHEPGPTSVKTLAAIKSVVEGWYQDRGYVFGYISHFDGMDTGKIIAHVTEGKVNRVAVVYMDDEGNPKKGGGETDPEVVLRELPFKAGQLYNTEDGRKALRDIFALQLFDNVQVFPRQNPKDESKIDVDIMVKERPMRTAEIECEWAIAPDDAGRPGLVSLVPGGQMLFEHRNLQKKGRQLSASVTAQNFLQPAEDLGFRLEYKQPYLWGPNDPHRAALAVSAFNSRKLSGVFTPGPGGEEVPPVWVDRGGAKIALQESYSRNSKGSLGIVLERVTTRDESGALTIQGSKQTSFGGMAVDGPPTTMSDTGVDRLAFLQGNLARDATYFLNGTPIGARDLFQVEQGLGLGSGSPLFNRHVASLTRFIKLRDPPAGSSSPPPVLVTHARYGATIGDMASYDAFTLGGPYSVRGFNVGELAACRRFLEAAVELRVPVFGRQVYAFFEHGTDLGSSAEVRGNPTEYYRRAGSGTSKGVGIKLGAVRAEYATDGKAGAIFMRFGERF